jgi:hypothetical protein
MLILRLSEKIVKHCLEINISCFPVPLPKILVVYIDMVAYICCISFRIKYCMVILIFLIFQHTVYLLSHVTNIPN